MRRAAWFVLLVIAFVESSAAASESISTTLAKQILILYETSRTSQLVVVSDREIPSILNTASNDGTDYYAEFVDPRRFADRDYQQAFSDFLLSKYHGKQFDLIIAMGDNALAFINGTRGSLYPQTPVVFFASGPSPHRPVNSTGVFGRLDLIGSVGLALALQPDLRNVFVINGADNGRGGYEAEARAQLRPFEHRLAFTYLTDLNRTDLEAQVAHLPPHSAVYFLSYREGGTAESRPLDSLERIAALANAPTYSWVDSTMSHGIVGGSLKSQRAQAQAVARLGSRVLRGERADAIPIVAADFNVAQVDWRQMQRWGIGDAHVPVGTLVLFREPTLWDRYNTYVVAALAALMTQSALIAGLLVQKRRRRRAEDQARDSAAKLRSSYERIRDLGGRLLDAQEAERARIARELHDDISQQLALLAFDLDLLRGEGPLQRRQSDRLVQGACERVQGAAKSVHALSHRLHPVRLQMLGLVTSLRALAQELSTCDVPVSFSHDDVPAAIPEEITLCLFRVVQEALQNALKHSAATHVAVHLVGHVPGGLVLTVVDDGIGFDVEEAWACGLGLVSMSERVESVDGRLGIRSTPGGGTHLEVAVPIQPARAAYAATAAFH